jgi:hypothetical protein
MSKSYVIKHEPSGMFIAISDEIGPFSLNEAKDCVDIETGWCWFDDNEILVDDLSIYEVEVTLGNKVS